MKQSWNFQWMYIEFSDLSPSSATLPGMPSVVEFHNAAYAINGRALVENVSFEINSGETIVLLGRSGSGKTTTLKLINRLLEPTTGEVLVEGKRTTDWDPIRLRRRIGYVIQEVGLFPHFTVERNVALVPSLEHWPEERIEARVRETLSLVGLGAAGFGRRLPRELSGGQRQRVGVARALAADPGILLFDEPFGALDPVTRAEIQKEFRRLQKRLGKTMIFVTHDIREAFILGDRIGLMKDGKLVALVVADEFRSLDHPEARAFLESYA
jgi:osmoprotectant transport system ATP-binding protein